jgi:predicted O-methyltransferase YrrM
MNDRMAAGLDEPDSPDAVRKWVASNHSTRDVVKRVARQSDEHRVLHRCNTYPFDDGRTLGLIAAATGANRILDIGTGLGYSALWLAHGCGPKGSVTTIERDPLHAKIAKENFRNEGYDDAISVREGEALAILPGLRTGFDLIVVDGDIVDYAVYLEHVDRLLRPRGLLLTSNLFSSQYDRTTGNWRTAEDIRRILLNERKWTTAFLPNGDCLSVLK